MQVFRVRFTIRVTDSVPRMPAVPAPLVYALLCEAFGKGTGRHKGLPDNVMVIAPEQLRLHLDIGDTYAFGINVIAANEEEAGTLIRSLQTGLQRHGQERAGGRDTLAGNFALDSCEDLFAGKILDGRELPAALDPQHVLAECQALMHRCEAVTLNFHTPLRWQIPGGGKHTRKLYFDRRHFDAGLFLQKVPHRLAHFGLDTSPGPNDPDYAEAAVLDNRLVWIDCDHRSGAARSFSSAERKAASR